MKGFFTSIRRASEVNDAKGNSDDPTTFVASEWAQQAVAPPTAPPTKDRLCGVDYEGAMERGSSMWSAFPSHEELYMGIDPRGTSSSRFPQAQRIPYSWVDSVGQWSLAGTLHQKGRQWNVSAVNKTIDEGN